MGLCVWRYWPNNVCLFKEEKMRTKLINNRILPYILIGYVITLIMAKRRDTGTVLHYHQPSNQGNINDTNLPGVIAMMLIVVICFIFLIFKTRNREK
jgi:hypothetical protein